MSELKYDPELLYVARIRFTEEILGRFHDKEDATQSLETIWASYDGEVIDTTPKPKIPEDAQHITWGDEKVAYSRYVDGLWYGWIHTGISEDELLDWIGNDEVTVLVRKEES